MVNLRTRSLATNDNFPRRFSMNVQQTIFGSGQSTKTPFEFPNETTVDDDQVARDQSLSGLTSNSSLFGEPVRCTIDLDEDSVCNPFQFCFRKDEGHNVYPVFTAHFMSHVRNVDILLKKVSFACVEILGSSTSAEICSALPRDHIDDDPNTFIACLFALTCRQGGGQDGFLPNNGEAAYFPIKVDGKDIFVRILWNFHAKEWRYFVGPIDRTKMIVGRRVVWVTSASFA